MPFISFFYCQNIEIDNIFTKIYTFQISQGYIFFNEVMTVSLLKIYLFLHQTILRLR